MSHLSLPALSSEKEQLLADYQEYLHRWRYYLAEEKLRAARYFLALGPERLAENRPTRQGLSGYPPPPQLLASNSIMYLLTAFIQALSPEQQACLGQVDRHTISAYVDRLQARSLGGATINNHLSAIHGFFRFLLDQEQVTRNPVLESHYLREREDPLPQAMSDEESARFLAVIQKPMDRALFLLLLRSGLRVGEVAAAIGYRPALRNPTRPKACGIPSPPNCSTPVCRSPPSRSCWDTTVSPPPSAMPGSTTAPNGRITSLPWSVSG